MNTPPSGTSVPSIPLGEQPVARSDWSVPGAIGAAALIFGGSHLLGFLMLQGYVGWAAGWSYITDLGAPDKLAASTRHALVVSIQLLVTALQLVVACWLAGRGGRDRWRSLQLNWVSLGVGGWIAAIGLVIGVKVLATLATAGFGKGNPREEMAPFIELARDHWIWLGFVVAAIAAGLIEELIFRAILSRTLEDTRLGFWGGAGLTSAVFALMHLQYGPSGQFVVFALGMAFSWLRARYQSIWPGVVTHALNNAIALVALKAIA